MPANMREINIKKYFIFNNKKRGKIIKGTNWSDRKKEIRWKKNRNLIKKWRNKIDEFESILNPKRRTRKM